MTIANKNELSIHDVSKTKMAGTERRQVVHQSSRKQRKRQGSVGTETANYKSQMDYQNIDFDGDKVKQYEAVREAMARIYEEPSFFRPPFITPTPDKEVDQEERAAVEKQRKIDKDLIKKGYTWIQEKIKEIRQNFSTAVTSSLLSTNVAFPSRNVRC